MKAIDVTTPSGHTATIKPFLSFGEMRKLERVWAQAMDLDPKTQETHLDGGAIYDAQDAAVKLLVTKLVTAEGQTFQEPDQILEAIMTMKPEDGKAIYTKINEITNDKQLPPPDSDEKKA